MEEAEGGTEEEELGTEVKVEAEKGSGGDEGYQVEAKRAMLKS
jgi:hypothetical protein